MKLKEYVEKLNEHDLVVKNSVNDDDLLIDVNSVTYDSSKATKGTLFVCKGASFKETYLQDALAKGAICFVFDKTTKLSNDYSQSNIEVKDIREAMAVIANYHYKKAWSNFVNIGITGTKGKTTILYFLKSILEAHLQKQKELENKKIGLLSSIITSDGKNEEEAILTTPETFELHEFFQKMSNNNVKYNVMEVSSQALKFHRTLGVNFDVACFTNISNDHIGTIEHPDFEDYFSSKLRLLHQCHTAVINNDIPEKDLRRILDETQDCQKVVTYGLKEDSDVTASNIDASIDGTKFNVNIYGESQSVMIPIIGDFNVNNALGAIAVAMEVNIPAETIIDGLAKVQVPGRMTIFNRKDKDYMAIVDFAHNKLSYIALFESLKSLMPDAKYTIVFGCPGAKGLNRRKDLGQVVNDYATKVVLTEEDCGMEDPVDICNDIDKYIDHDKVDVTIITDREEAIKKALDTASKGEVVIIAGKSADTTLKRGTEYVPVETDLELCEKYYNK